MNVKELARILTCFADNPADIDLSKGKLLVQIREEMIEAELVNREGELFVVEDGTTMRASEWIPKRVARLPMLAERIRSYIPEPEHFVCPSGKLMDQLAYVTTLEEKGGVDAALTTLEVLGRRPAGVTSVLYLTSDAGEGKTTLINHLARQQAERYKQRTSDWLLVPIPLGGRAFLRFDDVVIAALVNRLRFQLLYFDAFLELVKLGLIVPAFDGFEEMFIEGSSGEAVSALGSLVGTLDSAGTVLFAARKAYFEYQSFRTQAKLFDVIGTHSVSFARMALDRWSRPQFIEYASSRNLDHPSEVFDEVSSRLGSGHPLLTRAVLVRRLVDVATEARSLAPLLDRLSGASQQSYFFEFVNAIVEREAHEKWLDTGGDALQPLLPVEEHHELLSQIALEMWISSTDALRSDVIDAIADVFSEAKHLDPARARQIRERIKQHSLIVATDTPRGGLSFDHEDFKKFFLGEALGRLVAKASMGELRHVFGIAGLPREVTDQGAACARRLGCQVPELASALCRVAKGEHASSFVRDNCGAFLIALVDGVDRANVVLECLRFPPEALRNRVLRGVVIKDSHFQPTSVSGVSATDCTFQNCVFERLEIGARIDGVISLDRCEFRCLLRTELDDQLFDPTSIQVALKSYGFAFQQGSEPLREARRIDDRSKLVERALRIFLRSTHVNESIFKLKLGSGANVFLADVLPELRRRGILQEIPYHGAGVERRFKLALPMQQLQMALQQSGGSFEAFIELVSKPS